MHWQTWGINLDWSSTPVYEWELRGGTTGAVVPANTTVSLYNTHESQSIVYCPRDYGVNIRWALDCTAR